MELLVCGTVFKYLQLFIQAAKTGFQLFCSVFQGCVSIRDSGMKACDPGGNLAQILEGSKIFCSCRQFFRTLCIYECIFCKCIDGADVCV